MCSFHKRGCDPPAAGRRDYGECTSLPPVCAAEARAAPRGEAPGIPQTPGQWHSHHHGDICGRSPLLTAPHRNHPCNVHNKDPD